MDSEKFMQGREDECVFFRGNQMFRYRVGAIIIENDHLLLIGNETVDFYYSVGGGVKLGETAEDAILREVFEETNVNYKIDRLAFIQEKLINFDEPGFLQGVNCHEIGFYFIMQSQGNMNTNCTSLCQLGKEYLKWIPLSKLENIKLYPKFFKKKLKTLPEYIEHLVVNDMKIN